LLLVVAVVVMDMKILLGLQVEAVLVDIKHQLILPL
jgi:hypothetical protein